MSANLDKALDEIIDFNKKQVRKTSRSMPRKVSKNVNRRRAGAPVGMRKAVVTVDKSTSVLEAAYATKVNVEGLPRDIKEVAVRVC